MAVKRVPDGYHRVTPHLTVKNAAAMIEFYKKAFGAVEKGRAPGPDGKTIMHAAIQIGDSIVFLNDEFPEMGAFAPVTTKAGSTVTIHLYVDDADKQFQQALAAGCEVVMPLGDQFWGDRYGMVKDPSGHTWSIGSHMEDLTPDQIKERMGKAFCP
ncbi:MAG TPA: VOC family protein [Gemmataceae bacterium]|nr:VOC family protein [Gemmataceae bacterium]